MQINYNIIIMNDAAIIISVQTAMYNAVNNRWT